MTANTPYITKRVMNKDLDYQIAPVVNLYKPRLQIQKEVKLALTRVASSTVSAASYFSTLQGSKKTITEKEVLKAA